MTPICKTAVLNLKACSNGTIAVDRYIVRAAAVCNGSNKFTAVNRYAVCDPRQDNLVAVICPHILKGDILQCNVIGAIQL